MSVILAMYDVKAAHEMLDRLLGALVYVFHIDLTGTYHFTLKNADTVDVRVNNTPILIACDGVIYDVIISTTNHKICNGIDEAVEYIKEETCQKLTT